MYIKFSDLANIFHAQVANTSSIYNTYEQENKEPGLPKLASKFLGLAVGMFISEAAGFASYLVPTY